MSTVEPQSKVPAGVAGHIPRELLRLALPVMGSYLLRVGYQWVDALWVRGLGVEATAAVTTSVFVIWIVFSLHDVFGLGVTAFVSQLLGAGDRARAGVAAFKGLRAALMMGLVGTALGVFGARWIYELMGADPVTTEHGVRYLSVVLAAAPLPMIAATCENIMRAAGDSRTPLILDLCAIALNAVLDPILIFGWGPFPAMGVAGAAWATVFAQAMLVTGYLFLAWRGHRALPLARHAPGPPVRILGMGRVGLPAALIGILFSVVYVAFSRSAARYGAASLAIVGIANRIEALQFVISAAIGTAGAALVGQNLGAGRPDRAMQVIRTGLGWSFWMSLAISVTIFAFPDVFIDFFTRDPEVHRVGVPYLRLLVTCMVFVGVEMVLGDSILGSGHTTAISWIYSVFSLARIPLAFLVPDWTGTGVLGIAWVIVVTCVMRTIVMVAWAARGTWKTGLRRELHGADTPVPGPPEGA